MPVSMNKRMCKTFGKVAFPVVLLASCFASNVSAQTRIRLATLIPSGTSYHHSLLEMGEKWKKASNGNIALTIYPDGIMGSEDEIVRRMRVGQLQAAVLTVSGLSAIDPAVGALQKMPLSLPLARRSGLRTEQAGTGSRSPLRRQRVRRPVLDGRRLGQALFQRARDGAA